LKNGSHAPSRLNIKASSCLQRTS